MNYNRKRYSDHGARINAERRERYASDPAYRERYLQRYYALGGVDYARRMLLQRRQKALTRLRARERRDG